MTLMKVRTNLRKLTAGFLCLFMLLIPTSAMAKTRELYRIEVANNVSIGNINISLEEYEKNKDGDVVSFDDRNYIVTPGESISRIVNIKNLANPAWIRIKSDFEFESGMEGVDESMLRFASADWIKRGDYYYLPYSIDHNETVSFIKSIYIPKDWDEHYANKRFRIIFTAEAVQERNFTPDFKAKDPWFGTIIEQSVHDYYRADKKDGKAFQVVTKGGAEGLMQIDGDFFSAWEEMMPGDTWTDYLDLKNGYNKRVQIYFYTETDTANGLADLVTLLIKDGDTIVYRGPLSGTIDRVMLCDLAPGAGCRLDYSLYVPSGIGNAYSMAELMSRWIFECEMDVPGKKKEKKVTDVSKDTGDAASDDRKTAQADTDKSSLNPVKTGDVTTILAYILLAGASGCIIWIFYRRKRREDQKNA